MDIDTEIEVAIKGHSSPTIGRGIPHEGQAGYIVYEGEMPGLVAAIKRACNAFKIDDALSAARRFYASDVAPLIAERDRLAAEVERLTKERDAWRELYSRDLDPPVCRLQVPDGWVPGNAREAAEGWHAAYGQISTERAALKTDRDRLAAEVKRLAVTLGKERGEAREALDAAESILRYTPQISTNCNGTKPGMTTQHALGLVRDALAKLDAPNAPAPRPVTDDEVRAALGLYRHDADPGASVRSMRAALEQFVKEREW